jgi:hypothetical protein
MGIVTIVARLLLIGIVHIYELLALRFGILVALETQLSVDSVQKVLIRRRVRLVAGEAAVFTFDGLMFRLHARARILVTLEAEIVSRPHEQRGLFRRMWIVTGQAVSILEGLMLHKGAARQILRIMTFGAKLPAFRDCFEGIFIIRIVMARLAFGADHRIVGARLQKLGLLRRVGVVAAPARLAFHGIAAVRLREGGIVAFVTRGAECPFRLGKQIPLRGGMGEMTAPTSLLLHGLVYHGLAVAFLLVAFKANRVPLGAQQMR